LVGDGDIDKPPHIFHLKNCMLLLLHSSSLSSCIPHLFPLVSCKSFFFFLTTRFHANLEWTETQDRDAKQTKQNCDWDVSLSLSRPHKYLLAAAALELHLDGWAVIGSGSSTSSHTHIQESGTSFLHQCQETETNKTTRQVI
jgi:hypothetical protein